MSQPNITEAIDILKKAKDNGIRISYDADDLVVQLQQDRVIDKQFLRELKENKQNLIAYFKQYRQPTQAKHARQPITPRTSDIQLPLSFSQERLWIVDRLEGSRQYHIPVVLQLSGTLQVDVLEQVLKALINRHEVLRTVILEEGDSVFQQVNTAEQWQLQQLRANPQQLDAITTDVIERPFNLAADYLLRAVLVTLSAEEHVLVVVLHHIAADGWSLGIIVDEIMNDYQVISSGNISLLPAPPIQYADYAIWQRTHIAGQILQTQLQYWGQQLKDTQALQLPTDRPRPSLPGKQGAEYQFSIDATLTDTLRSWSQEQGATLFMTLLTAFKVLLSRYSRQTDICVGSPVSGRTQQEIEGLVGFFINTIALRSHLDGNPAFVTLLQQVRETTLAAYEHQDTPFEKVVETVVKERDLSRSPLFQVMFVLQNTPPAQELSLGNLQVNRKDIPHQTAVFDLTLSMVETPDGMNGAIEYSSQLFSESTIERLCGHFRQLLQSIAQDPYEKIHTLPMLTDREEEQLLYTFNNTARDYPLDSNLVTQFQHQVQSTPDAPALSFNGASVSYHELDIRATQLALHLQQQGIKEKALIPVCLQRSFDTIIAIWAVLKAGAAYVPIDPEYPEERIRYILDDTSAEIILTDKVTADRLKPHDNQKMIVVDEINYTVSAPQLNVTITPAHIAYVIYTSGSTGKPKGVLVPHKGVVNLALGQREALRLTPGIRYLQFASLGFDASAYEIFNTLLSGGTLVLATKERLQTADGFASLVKEEHVSVVTLPPSYLHLVKEVLGPIHTVVSAGEALYKEDSAQIIASGVRLINAYGPTENSVCTTLTDQPLQEQQVVIGTPVPNVQVYILDAFGGLCPVGVPGEICAAGAGVASGYLNQPQLTADKFIPHPFSGEKDDRLYRTGDLGRWLPDGNIEYLGRIDDQVKIRGYRIETGEIEHVLTQSEAIDQAVVLVNTDPLGNKRLAAYIVPNGLFDREKTITALRQQLPEYMIPAIWITLQQLPVTANGKIDKKALPAPETDTRQKTAYVAPVTPHETLLAEIWQELLGIAQISVHDNFFERGGDSIISIQVVSRLKQAGYSLHPRQLFQQQTIKGLAPLLKTIGDEILVGEQGTLTGPAGLLPIQHWFFEVAGNKVDHFNQSVLLELDRSVSHDKLSDALNILATRHDALRFIYDQVEGEWQQQYSVARQTVNTVDLSNVPTNDFTARLTALADETQRALNIKTGHIMQAVWIQTPATQSANRLLLVIHHLAVDGVSWRILLQDLTSLLQGQDTATVVTTAPKTTSYRQWQQQLSQYAAGHHLLAQLPYWEQIQSAYTPLQKELSADAALTMTDTWQQIVSLDENTTRRLLQDTTNAYRTDTNELLITALASTLTQWTGTTSINIGMEGHGREEGKWSTDLSQTVGWFTSLFPLQLSVEPHRPLGEQIRVVKEQLRNIPDKGLGYGILKYINKTPSLTGTTPWDVTFNYLGQSDNITTADSVLTMAAESAGQPVAADFPLLAALSVNAIITDGRLLIHWTAGNQYFRQETISNLANTYLAHLQELISHCATQSRTQLSPVDYYLSNIASITELDRFLDTPWQGQPRRGQVEAIYRLTGVQEGMLFHSLYDGESSTYTEQLSCPVYNVQVPALRQSWEQLVKKHTILRSAFYYDAFAIPVQCVYKTAALPFTVLDYTHIPAAEQTAALRSFEEQDAQQRFDFTAAPLMRVTLIRLNETTWHMVWTSHHILFDGWSLPILVEGLLAAYEELSAGLQPAVGEIDTFEDYIRYLEQQDKNQVSQYWRKYLADLEEGTLLPFISATADRTKGVGHYRSASLLLDESFTTQMNNCVQQHRITTNTLMQGVWACLLAAYAGRSNVAYGVTVSGRPEDLTGVEQRVGLYINTLPLHAAVTPGSNITHWLQDLQAAQQRSREYQYAGLSDITRWTSFQGDLFDTSITFQNYPVSEVVGAREWKLQVGEVEAHPHTNYPLTIIISIGATANLLFSYNSDLLPEHQVQAIIQHFEHALRQIVTGQATLLEDISLLTLQQQQQLLDAGASIVTYPVVAQTFPDMFSAQAAQQPQATALAFEGRTLSYGELEEKASRLANYLRNKGVKPDTFVPLCIDRSLDMIVGILAILKTGAAYVPVDPDYLPLIDRIGFMLADTDATVIVTNNRCADKLPVTDQEIIAIDGDWDLISLFPATPLNIRPDASQLAYLIYTSGSTGNPKGVMVTHHNLADYLYGLRQHLPIDNCRSFGLLSSIATDLGNTVLFGALATGATLHLFTRNTVSNPPALHQYFADHQVDAIKIVPSHWKALSDNDQPLLPRQLIIFGGEALDTGIIHTIRDAAPHCTVVNHYGPTETTIGKLLHIVSPDNDYEQGIPVGKPFSNTRVRVVAPTGKLCPVGVPGELWIGGEGVAAGYLNNPALTAEKFITDPLHPDAGTRYYRTGDRVKYLPDGNILFLGRVDDQVKIRGYRVEIKEVENKLNACPLVSQGIIIAGTDAGGGKNLLAYVIPAPGFNREAVIEELKAALPDYMVPAFLVELDSFPLLPNGKINRRALPDPVTTAQPAGDHTAPHTALQQQLSAIWANLLEVDQVGLQDDFFELGGHSLLAVRLISLVKKELAIEMSINDIFDHPTVASLAAKLGGVLPAEEKEVFSHIRLMHRGQHPQPLFLLPGSQGITTGYESLAAALTPFTVYGLQMTGAGAGESPLKDIAAIAREHIIRIKTVQPAGPYRFVAHSFGAFVAYEIGRQLEAAGETVNGLLLLDARTTQQAPDKQDDRIIPVLVQVLREAFDQYKIAYKMPPDWSDRVTTQLQQLPDEEKLSFVVQMVKTQVKSEQVEIDWVAQLLDLQLTNINIPYQVEGRLQSPILLVKAETPSWPEDPGDLGWSAHSKGFTAIQSPGDHFSMIKGQQADKLAKALTDWLNA